MIMALLVKILAKHRRVTLMHSVRKPFIVDMICEVCASSARTFECAAPAAVTPMNCKLARPCAEGHGAQASA